MEPGSFILPRENEVCGRDYKWAGESLGDDKYGHCLDYGDDFFSMSTCQNVSYCVP